METSSGGCASTPVYYRSRAHLESRREYRMSLRPYTPNPHVGGASDNGKGPPKGGPFAGHVLDPALRPLLSLYRVSGSGVRRLGLGPPIGASRLLSAQLNWLCQRRVRGNDDSVGTQ